ncbi:MAG TPA: flagellar basal body L-ring protein FlgH [Candidatus Acidoferrum sp.]|nr:flagellar basal body L-ring protein FlgH [Candidatus Acidoferrum sp.]
MRIARTQSVLLLLAAVLATNAFGAAGRRSKKPKKDTASTGLEEYLKRARTFNLPAPETVGSLWVSSGPLADLGTDYKARNAGDLLVIHLVDNFTAATAGENNQSRAFSANSQVTGFVGAIGAANRLQNLFGANSANSLDGKGSSTMSSSVSLDLAAHVIEVLPNKTLVVQATRDVTVGNDRQTVYIRGLVRPGDIALDNSILSSSIADLEVEIKGKGAVADASRQPNVVIRWLLKLLTF